MNATPNDIAQGTLLITGLLSLVLAALVLYIILLLARIETILRQIRKMLNFPEVPRDSNGQPLRRRL